MLRSKILLISLIVLLIVSLYFITTTSIYVRYWADDFCTAAVLREHGFLQAQKIWWLSWSGRFSFTAIVSLVELFGDWIVKTIPVIVFSLLVASIYPIVRIIIPKEKLVSLVASLLFVLLTLINAPNIIQSFYWQTGVITYTVPFIFLNLFLYLLVSTKKRSLYFPLLLTFIAGGFSEAYALAQSLFIPALVLMVIIINTHNKKLRLQICAAGFVGAILALFVTYLSPGNAVRGAAVTKPESIYFVMNSALIITKWYLIRLFSISTFAYSLLLLLGYIFIFTKNFTLNVKTALVIISVSAVSVFSIAFVVIASGFYTMSQIPPDRTLFIVVYMIFMLIAIAGVVLKGIVRIQLDHLIFPLVVVCSILLIKSTYLHWSQVKEEVSGYANEWDTQESRLPNINNVTPIGQLDGFLENKGWVGTCAASYYGFEKITILE